MEHVAHFPMSRLTLRPLHGGQTSQGKCARVAPALIPLMSLMGAWQGVSEVEICPIFLTILPRIKGETKYIL